MIETPRFIIGIDLGTTCSAIFYVDTEEKPRNNVVKPFRIPQLISRGNTKRLPLLPSFCYLLRENEFPAEALALPWDKADDKKYIVGQWAKELGALLPTQSVGSAKSWLSTKGAYRKDPILPLETFDEKRRLSPVFALSMFLQHIVDAWNSIMGEGNEANYLENQFITITIPASFDEVARKLTVDAAHTVGLKNITLLEEPQSAFYSWLMDHEGELSHHLKPNNQLLVCDVGGGTTDFTIIEVVEDPIHGMTFKRTAVGYHLLLGGDNMDAALTAYLEKKIQRSFERQVWEKVKCEARLAKELLLNRKSKDTHSIWIPGKGSEVIGGGISLELNQSEIQTVLADGFFGLYPFEEALKLKKGGGIQAGLPFESEPSITKQLASFLKRNHIEKMPSYLLFNGGAMKPLLFQERIKCSLEKWYGEEGTGKLHVLSSSNLELAVAKGAAYYGKVKKGLGIKISSGVPRGIYLGIEVKLPSQEIVKKALSIVPRGAQEGEQIISEHIFELLPNTPASFQLYHSSTRLADSPGSLVDIVEEEMTPLPTLQTVLRYGKQKETIPISMGATLSEIGTIDIWLQSIRTEHKWHLEFDIRGEIEQSFVKNEEVLEEALLVKCKQIVIESFALGGAQKLMSQLEECVGKPKNDFSPHLLRPLFDTLLDIAPKRKFSSDYAVRFWNAAGFFLRPGLGYPLDNVRIKGLWQLILEEGIYHSSLDVLIQKLICYRRVSCGFSKGQQMQIFHELMPNLFSKKDEKKEIKGNKGEYLYAEKIRALASFEWIERSLKEKLGEKILKRILQNKGKSYDFWSLARLGARTPLYSSIGNILPPAIVESWIKNLISAKELEKNSHLCFAIAAIARQSDTRQINLSEEVIHKVKEFLSEHSQESDFDQRLLEEQKLSSEHKNRLFGDHLPCALTLREVVS